MEEEKKQSAQNSQDTNVVDQQKKFEEAVLKQLSVFSNAPTMEEISEWKRKDGEILASALSDDEIYIFKPLCRKDHLRIKKQMLEQQKNAEQVSLESNEEYEQEVIKTCLLWQSKSESLELKAGSIEVLFEQIMQNSNFMNPVMAAQLVIKL